MMNDDNAEADESAQTARVLTPEAQRALAEADGRRKLFNDKSRRPAEVGGRDGPEPTRFGDWEKGGLTSDF
jgi:hypothetical protein